MKLAEHKRHFVFSEGFNSLGAVGAADPGIDTFVVNAFGSMNIGTGDASYTGNEFLDPLVAVNLSIDINWAALIGATAGAPMVRVDLYLIAVNEQYSSTVIPRLTSVSEDNTLFLAHPDNTFTWQMNTNAVTVIKRKKMVLSPKGLTSWGTGATTSTFETRSMKVAKRLRGKKEFETSYSTGGVQTQSVYLKGWNYYWVCVTAVNRPSANAVTANSIRVIGDRYVYFKDF